MQITDCQSSKPTASLYFKVKFYEKNKSDSKGFVFSTNPDFEFDHDEKEFETLPPAQQKLRLQLETKHRGGKTASIVMGFIGSTQDLEDLAKKLKSFCGTGDRLKMEKSSFRAIIGIKCCSGFKNGYTNVKKSGG